MTQVSEDQRLDELVDLIVQLGSGNLSARLPASDAADPVDAVITGVNLLAGELDRVHALLEQGRSDQAIEAATDRASQHRVTTGGGE